MRGEHENPEQRRVRIRMEGRARKLMQKLPVQGRLARRTVFQGVARALIRAYWSGSWERY